MRRSDAADAATAEKQISLLTRGLTNLPSSPVLLLALLRAYAAVAPDAAALSEKWRGVLARQGGSWLLWREFLAQQYVLLVTMLLVRRVSSGVTGVEEHEQYELAAVGGSFWPNSKSSASI
jgi:hypothetical protein